jgi:hypothetical protein
MARHTNLKIAALLTTLVATLGIVAAGPATSADSGKAAHQTSFVGKLPLCC